MYTYLKRYMTPADLVKSLKSKGMIISSDAIAEEAIREIGYYRLKGYFFDRFDNTTLKYRSGTKFDDILKVYQFDIRLSRMIFDYLLKVEVTLRAHLTEALQINGDPLILTDPSIFKDKKLYWENASTISSEIERSKDVFIQHNFDAYEGAIPVWAAAEVMQYGTLSKVIKNLKPGTGTALDMILSNYTYTGPTGATIKPSQRAFCSWTQATNTMRNICAHNGRIYNRKISTVPELKYADQPTAASPSIGNGVYQQLLAMKYLKPNDSIWSEFIIHLQALISSYSIYVNVSKLFFPSDWRIHLS